MDIIDSLCTVVSTDVCAVLSSQDALSGVTDACFCCLLLIKPLRVKIALQDGFASITFVSFMLIFDDERLQFKIGRAHV